MALTKTQTVTLCVLIAAAPAVWQWHAIESARSSEDASRQTLRDADAELSPLRNEQRRLDHQLSIAQEQSARLQAALARRQSPRPTEPDATAYRWSEESDFVRVPKKLLSKIELAEQPKTRPEERSWEDTARPVLSKDGNISATVVEALDLSTNQADTLRSTLAEFSQQFEEVAMQHSALTNAAPEKLGFFASGGGNGEPKTLYTTAFPEEGAALEQQLRESLNSLIGPERTELFWKQARHDFNYRFSRFGKSPKAVTVVRFTTQKPPFYARGQVRDENFVENESRTGFFDINQGGGTTHWLLPAEFQNWWSDLSPTSPTDNHE